MRKKLTLEVDGLAVESFTTGAHPAADRGTVHGRMDLDDVPTVKTVCDWTLLGTNPTCCPCTP